VSELKACPFCPDGGKPEINDYFIAGVANHLNYFTHCSSCGIRTRSRKDYKGAVDDWNTRPIEETQAKLIIQLGDALDSAGDGGVVYPDQVEAEKAYEDWREKNK
jgi:hypothetical protein